MEFARSRLRGGELIVGAGAVVLLASTFLLHWFGLSAAPAPTGTRRSLSTSVNGWQGLTHLRWLILITSLVAVALVYFQATRRAPALPASLSVLVTVLGLVTSIGLIYRVAINPPGSSSLSTEKVGAFVGLVSAIALTYGGYRSLREEGLSPQDVPGEIDTIRLQASGGR